MICEACRHDKQTKIEFNIKENFASHSLELIHTDLCGPMRKNVLDRELYFMLMKYDYTRLTSICFLKKMLYAFKCFKIYKELVENEINL